MDRRRLIQIVVAVSALAVAVSTFFFSCRTVRAPTDGVRVGGQLVHPFPVGPRLFQMGLPVYMVGLLVLAVAAVVACAVLDRGRWPGRVVFVSGVGITLLTLLVQQSPATEAVLGSQIQVGSIVALGAGLTISVAGALWIVLRTRPTGRPAPA